MPLRDAPSAGPSHRLSGPDGGGAAASAAEGVDCLARSGPGASTPLPAEPGRSAEAAGRAFIGSYATFARCHQLRVAQRCLGEVLTDGNVRQ